MSIRVVVVLARPAGRADLGLVGRCSGQGHEGTEPPAVAVRGDELLGWHGFRQMGVAVGEGRHIPARHLRTARWLPVVVDRESTGRTSRRSNRAASPRRRCEVAPTVVMRCSAVSQSKQVGPGGATRDAIRRVMAELSR